MFKIVLTFGCFLVTLVALFYLGMGGKVEDLAERAGFFSLRRQKPEPVFYQSIGGGDTAAEVSGGKQVTQVYTLELATVRSRHEADRLVSKLLENRVRAFYSEVREGGKVSYSVRKGVFSSLAEARSASKSLVAHKALKNRVVELN